VEQLPKDTIDQWVIDPVKQFINNSTSGGIALFLSALVALLISNSPWSHQFHSIWETEISLQIGGWSIEKSLHHWINDGLVSVFFFVIGLELKREVIAGELSNPRYALLPVAAAIAGMAIPAAAYLIFNYNGNGAEGWGVPMATDIAFALGVLYFLGDRVPVSLKVFLTTLAVVDDLGAVLVIAFFYTPGINLSSLLIGLLFLLVLALSNRVGIRSTLYYAIMGIIGLWFTFYLSGIHPTIAAVLLAFTIPARPKVRTPTFRNRLENFLTKLRGAPTIDAPLVSEERHKIVTNIRKVSKMAITPLQRLEHALHPFVAFVVMPVFALSNAGVVISDSILSNLFSPVATGIFSGLLLGKVVGIGLAVWLLVKTGLCDLPEGMGWWHVIGSGFLAGVGFTMSLFISELAFTEVELLSQAKIAVLISSVLASLIGYFLLRSA